MTAADVIRRAALHLPATLLAGSQGLQRQGSVVDGQVAPQRPDAAARATDGGMTVLVASSGFEKGLGPRQAAAAIAEGVRAESPSSRVLHVPVIDGGEGFAEEIVRISAGTIEHLYIVDPHGMIVTAQLGLIGRPAERTAVIGVGEAADLRRLPADRRDPTRASSRGVGQLIAAALDRGARRIIIGCGDSGANDGGIGMASEFGIRFLDANRSEIAEAGGLQRLATIDLSHRDPRLDQVSIEAVVNPYDDLLGEYAVTRIFGPLTGASQAQVRRLERGLARYADVIRQMFGIDVTSLRGGGASGGLGAGLAAFMGARLTSRLDFMRHNLGLETSLAVTDLAIAAADSGDGRSTSCEVPAWIVSRAKALGLPVIVLAGQCGIQDESSNHGDPEPARAIDATLSSEIAPGVASRDEALPRTGEWLRHAGARAMRMALAKSLSGIRRHVPAPPLVGARMATRS